MVVLHAKTPSASGLMQITDLLFYQSKHFNLQALEGFVVYRIFLTFNLVMGELFLVDVAGFRNVGEVWHVARNVTVMGSRCVERSYLKRS